MIEKKRVMALIPARGGSKGIKGKNIINLEGKPLIAYTIEAALNSKYIDEVYVSTDSEQIAEKSLMYGAKIPFMRPKYLASDTAKTVDAVCHFIKEMESLGEYFDILVLLQPTAPLRTSNDINKALECFCVNKYQSLVSVSEVNDNPILMRKIDQNGIMTKLLNENSTMRRQDMEKVYRVNGSIYINNVMEINSDTSFNDNIIPYIMPKEHSIDIDEYVDLEIARYYLHKDGYS